MRLGEKRYLFARNLLQRLADMRMRPVLVSRIPESDAFVEAGLVVVRETRDPFGTRLLIQLHPLVLPQVSHLRQVPFRTMVKFWHSGQETPS